MIGMNYFLESIKINDSLKSFFLIDLLIDTYFLYLRVFVFR